MIHPRKHPEPPRRRWWLRLPIIVAVFCVGLAVLVYLAQDGMIYLRRGYPPGLAEHPAGCTALPYRSSQGAQVGFYRAPAAGGAPQRLWLCFGGNASLALQWLSVIESCPDPQAGFLLVDYPGYGACEGAPSPAAILEGSEAALAALSAKLGESVESLIPRCGVLGHSLGCGAALQFAARHPVHSAVLVAPFTSLRDMARRTVGWPLCWLLKADFDNRARLDELTARNPPAAITIIHGARDEIIPVTMGRELSAAHPDRVRFAEIADADHNGILRTARDRLMTAMLDGK